MKATSVIAGLMLIMCARTWAGEMYGSITQGDKPVGEKVKVEVSAAGKSTAGETDKNGSYRIFVKEKGKCTFSVHYKDQVATTDIFSYDKSLRYDWVLELKDGKYQLKRK
jgi:hypothetical protein